MTSDAQGSDAQPGERDEAAVFRAVTAELARHGAMSTHEIAASDEVRAALAAFLDPEVEGLSRAAAEEALDHMLDDIGTDLGWIVDGRHYLPSQAVPTAAVTVRVTETLIADGDLFDGPDLAPLANTGRRSFPTGDGDAAERPVPPAL